MFISILWGQWKYVLGLVLKYPLKNFPWESGAQAYDEAGGVLCERFGEAWGS